MFPVEREGTNFHSASGAVLRCGDDLILDELAKPVGLHDNNGRNTEDYDEGGTAAPTVHADFRHRFVDPFMTFGERSNAR